MAIQGKQLEYISDSLQIADNWRKKGDIIWEESCLSSVLMEYLAVAVKDCEDVDGAKAWFAADDNYSGILARYQELLNELVTRIDAGELPASTIAGNYPHLVFTHLAWALSEFGLGERFAGIASRPDVLELSTPFWQEYAKAISALIEGNQYTLGDLSLRGQEKYWRTYLHLIERATGDQDISSAVVEVDDAFAQRNSDNTIKDDAHEIEGSGEHPVRWDFRRDGLLNYIRSKR